MPEPSDSGFRLFIYGWNPSDSAAHAKHYTKWKLISAKMLVYKQMEEKMKKILLFLVLISILLISCEEKVTDPSSNGDENEAHFSFPSQGTNVSGTIYFTVEGNNIDRVAFQWAGSWTTDENAPFKKYCNTTNYDNGGYTVRASPVFEDGTSTSFTVDFWIAN